MTASEGPGRHRAGSTELLLASVINGMTIQSAAQVSGMGEETARRRLREPEVKAKLEELRISTLEVAADRLAALALAASVVLGQIMGDREMPAAVRVRAASEILGRVVPMRDAAQIEDRLAYIERALSRREQSARWAS